MHRRNWTFALIAVFALLLAACGGGDGDMETQPTETGAQPTAGDTAASPAEDSPEATAGADLGLPDLSGTTIEVTGTWTGSQQENFESVLSGFEAATGATVQYSSYGGESPLAVLGPRIEGGNPPDVAVIPQPGVVQDLVDMDALVELPSEVETAIDEHYAQIWKDLGTYNDTLYGVWFKAANKSTVWYNKNVFSSAGVEPPGTWEEFITAGETLAASGTTPYAIGGADGWTLTDWFENVYIRTAGGDMYDQLANHEIPWTDPSVTEALSTLAEVWDEDQLINDNPVNVAFPDSVSAVFADPQSPDAAAVYEADFVLDVIINETESQVPEDADFFTFPQIGDSGSPVVVGGDQAVLLQDSDGGKALLRYLASPQAPEAWASAGGFISPNQDLNLDVYPNDTVRNLAQAVVDADTVRFDLSDLQPAEFGATSGQGMFKLFQDFLSNPGDVEGTAQALEEAAAAAFEGGGDGG